MKIRYTQFVSSLIAMGLVCGSAHAELQPRDLDGNQTTAEAYYDTVLDITWLADANFAKTTGYDADGDMNWDTASAWVASLSIQNPVTGQVYDNWRLPIANPVNGTEFSNVPSLDGSTDTGINITSPQSELAYMFYVNLGNIATTIDGETIITCNGEICHPDPGPFTNVTYAYFTGTEWAPDPSRAGVFIFEFYINGYQVIDQPKFNEYAAWPVSPGDIGQTVTGNIPPLSNAGSGQTVAAGTTVMLSGAGSSDQDNHNPLTYAWTIVSAPAGSTAVLSDATSVSPSFVADAVGNYVLSLTVTDSLGLAGTPATVTISTYNTAPVAAAGPDQSIQLANTVVQLDGSHSYDGDGNPITALWSFTGKPAGSNASLSDPTSLTPTFVTDEHGSYVLALTVTDSFGTVSTVDSVTVTFDNALPVADAGDDQSTTTGTTIQLDGSTSSDANNDSLSFTWSFASKPANSTATLDNANSEQASFTPDVAGTYVVSLLVDDGTVVSLPDTVEILAVDSNASVIQDLRDIIVSINAINPRDFRNRHNKRELTRTLNRAIFAAEVAMNTGSDRFYRFAIGQLYMVLSRTDGCAQRGRPDRNDWIEKCSDQAVVYAQLQDAIERLEAMR